MAKITTRIFSFTPGPVHGRIGALLECNHRSIDFARWQGFGVSAVVPSRGAAAHFSFLAVFGTSDAILLESAGLVTAAQWFDLFTAIDPRTAERCHRIRQ